MSQYPCGVGHCPRWFNLNNLAVHQAACRRAQALGRGAAADQSAAARATPPRAESRLAGSIRQREGHSDADLGEFDFVGSGAGYGEGCGEYERDDVGSGEDDEPPPEHGSRHSGGGAHRGGGSSGGSSTEGSGGGGSGGGPPDSDGDGSGGSVDEVATSSAERLDAALIDATELSNTLFGSACVEGGSSQRQLGLFVRAAKHPGFNAALLFNSSSAVLRRVVWAHEVFAEGAEAPYDRLLVPCGDLQLPVGTPADPFVIRFDPATAISAVLRNRSITKASRLITVVTGAAEPSRLPGGAAVEAGGACFSTFGRGMLNAIATLHSASPKPVLRLLGYVALDESRASRFGNVTLFPVVLVILSLMRPYRHHKGAMPILAYLPVVKAAESDTPAARAGAATLLQRALMLSIVRPLQDIFVSGFVVRGVQGLAPAVRAVLGIHAVCSDNPALLSTAGIQGDGCVECIALPGDAGYLDPPHIAPRNFRTIADSTAARAAAATAPTQVAAAGILKTQSLRAGSPCAFDEWTLAGGMWAGCPHGISARSSLCWLHHFLLGYCKYGANGFDAVFGSCGNFTSAIAWRAAQEALARFIESQPSFDTGVERGRLVSLSNWSRITWWSGEAVFSSLVMATAALQAFRWPFKDRTLQRRLIDVGVQTLRLCVLAVAPQRARGGGATLQASVEGTHNAFAAVAEEFGFELDKRRKPHNAAAHLVAAGPRMGVCAEFDGGAGIEAVHPRGKAIYDASNKKGDVQEVVAKVISREAFVATDLRAALDRARDRLCPRAGAAACGSMGGGDDDDDLADGDDDDDDGDAHATCAYSTGALVPDMRVSSVSGQLPQLLQLLTAVFPNYCTDYHNDAPPASPLALPFQSVRCSLRHALKLRRRDVCSRLLPVIPACMVDDPYAALRPCVQLLRDDGAGGSEPDPDAFCELLLVLSYDVRVGPVLQRMSERKLRQSDAEDMVLVRRLKRDAAHCNSTFARFRVPGPSLSNAMPADSKFFELLPLSTLAQPRAAFPAIPSAEFSELPDGVLSPWSCPAVSVFLL